MAGEGKRYWALRKDLYADDFTTPPDVLRKGQQVCLAADYDALAREREVLRAALERLHRIGQHIGEELQPDVTDKAWDQHIVELAAALQEAERLLAGTGGEAQRGEGKQ